MSDVENTLAERGSRYGKFSGHAKITYKLKHVCQETPNWCKLNDSQKESIDMICHKMGRILNGDPNYDDSWRDIAGYATLIVNQLNGVDK